MADVAHIEIDRFLIEEKLDSGLRKLSYVLTEDQGACCLTEGLSSLGLSRLCDGLNRYLSPILRGVLRIKFKMLIM